MEAVETTDVTDDNELDSVFSFSEVSITEDLKEELRDRYVVDATFLKNPSSPWI